MLAAAMDYVEQIEACNNELSSSLKTLSDYFRSPSYRFSNSASDLFIPSDSPCKIKSARRSAMRSINRLQCLLTDPEDLIQRLACQSQLISCFRWLGDFQILPCIPLAGSVSTKDVADLVGVEEAHLLRVVRMTATSKFLCEPQPGFISHTALSSPFVTQLFYLDAMMFLAETAAPATLRMANATKLHGQDEQNLQRLNDTNTESTNGNAHSVAYNTPEVFVSAYEKRPKLQRQWSAFLQCTGDIDDSVAQVLKHLNWPNQGNVSVVDVNAHSTQAAQALARLFPALNFVVQLSDSAPDPIAPTNTLDDVDSRILIQRRSGGTTQPIKDAAVYMLRVPSPSPAAGSMATPPSNFMSELRAHLAILRDSPSATLVLAIRPIPEPGKVSPEVEALARMRDLTKLQLTGCGDTDILEFMTMIDQVDGGIGKLVLVKKLYSDSSATVALGVRYQTTNHSSNHMDFSSSI